MDLNTNSNFSINFNIIHYNILSDKRDDHIAILAWFMSNLQYL